ncbi:MAG: RNA polymerase factor sigma-54, partial [Hyphomicrobiales bacterium]
MAISSRLELRQSQSLVMTPQLQQAIKLLQLSNLELSTFVEAEIERNPLLEHAETEAGPAEPSPAETPDAPDEEWLDLDAAPKDAETSTAYDTDVDNVFPDSDTATGPGPDSGWTSVSPGQRAAGEDVNLEAFVAEQLGLKEHLAEQMQFTQLEPAQRMIAQHLIDMVEEDGYLRGDIGALAERLGAPAELVEETLTVLQGFEPAGVFARDLAECLKLQLQDRNRYDPAMAALLANLGLLAARDIAGLKKACGVSDEDLMDMIEEIKALNPKPGLVHGGGAVQPVVPDVFVRQRPDGSWLVELNSDTLPRVLVNQSYYATVAKGPCSTRDKAYLNDCLQTANWLVKSLDQRARTILKVAQEIVRQQDGFLTHGVRHLRPLNLKTVAEAISMHESTVSRVTSNKYMATARGIFELKYFFTSAIASADAGEAHSSEAVRH